jgi:orotidine 5'-phosphate decarboxylase subfamily 1
MRNFAIVVAADLPDPMQVLDLVKAVGSVVDGVKVSPLTLMQAGTDILGWIRDAIGDKPILVDLKVADIGFQGEADWQGTNAKIIRGLAGSGATHVTVHGFPGPVSVAEAIEVARSEGIGVLLLPLMSHAGASLFFSRPLGRSDLAYAALKAGLNARFSQRIPCNDVTDGIILLGEALDVCGYIGPATRPSDLERYRAATEKPIWCPGFGRQDRHGRNLEEQFRQWAQLLGPSSAAIVGTTICKAKDPRSAAQEVAAIRDLVTW